MKTKTLLFAALVSILFATTSCQKEENIMPATDHSFLPSQNTISTETILDGDEMIDETKKEKPQRFPKIQATQDSVIVNIAQINTYIIK